MGLIRFSIRTGAEFTPIYDELKSKGLDGNPRNAVLPDGHRIMFQVDRAGPELDNYFAGREEAYFNGGIVPNVSITETITELSGAVSIFRYTDVALRLTSGGSWKGNAITTQTLEGIAARRRKIA